MGILTPEVKEKILEDIYDGRITAVIAKDLGVKPKTLFQAIYRDPPFQEAVERARNANADMYFEKIPHLVDEYGCPQLARAKLDCLKFYLACINRSKYGERQTVEINQSVSLESALALAAGRVAPLLAPRDVTPDEVIVTPEDEGIASLL